jgi:hypothetical protein
MGSNYYEHNASTNLQHGTLETSFVKIVRN